MGEKNRAAARARWVLTEAKRTRAKELRENLRVLATVVRMEATRIKNRERRRRKALTTYHQRGFRRHLRSGLLAAARRMLTPTRQPVQLGDFIRATNNVIKKYKARQTRTSRRKLVKALRRRLENSMLRLKAGVSKSKTARELLGCDLDQLRLYLEAQFKPGMNWNNHGYHGWHVDHKTPLAAFALNQPGQAEQAFHFSNLQPLWAKENLEKRDKI